MYSINNIGEGFTMDFTTLKQELNRLFKQIATAISQFCKASLLKSQQKQAQIKTFAKQQYCNAVLFDIQYELFCVMQGGHYPFIPMIYQPKDIRIHSCQMVGQNTVFCYTLPVNTIPARTILDRLKSNINTDIYQFQQTIIYENGFENAALIHPYIIYGMYVIDIQPMATDILIKVATQYFP